MGLVVVEVDGDVEALGRDLKHTGEELPGKADRSLFRVVPEAEVAQHLEGGAVGEVTDLFNVGRTETALDSGEPRRGRLRLPHEIGLELLHTGAGEQRCGIAYRYERPAGKNLMTALLKETEKGVPDLVGRPWDRGAHNRIVRRAGDGCRVGGPGAPGRNLARVSFSR